jgi:hypothetical protein
MRLMGVPEGMLINFPNAGSGDLEVEDVNGSRDNELDLSSIHS